jgi:tape measure domain-containing protein
MLNLGDIVFGITANTTGLRAAQRELNNFGNSVDKTARGSSAAMGAVTTGIGVAVAAFASLATSAIQASMAIEKANVTLKAITGNAAVAAIEMDFVRKVSDQAGLSFAETAKAYARFYAAASAAGVGLDQIHKSFIEVSMAAGTLQLGIDDTMGVFRALEQMFSKGNVQAEELRGQLGDRLPAAFNIAAESMGVTTSELNKMLKQGKVLATEFIPAFTAAMAQVYNIDVTKPIETMQAAINRSKNALTFFLVELDKTTGLSAAFRVIIDSIAGALNYMAANMRTIISNLVGLATGIVTFAVAAEIFWALPAILGAVGTAITAVRSATTLLAAAQAALNAVMAANPIGFVITLLAALAAAFGLATWASNQMKKAIDANIAAFDDTASIKSYIVQQNLLGFAVRSTTAEMIKQLAAKNMLEGLQLQERAAALKSRADRLAEAARPRVAGSNIRYGGPAVSSFSQADRTGMNEEAASVREATERMKERNALLADLRRMMTLPEEAAAPGGGPAGSAGAAGSQADALRAVKEVIDDLINSQERLNKLYEVSSANVDDFLNNPESGKLVADMFKAQDILSKFSAGELEDIARLLNNAGFAGGAQEAMTELVTKARQANEQFAKLNSLADEIREAADVTTLLDQKMSALRDGSISPENLFQLDNWTKADQFLRGLDTKGLEQVTKWLAALGYEGDDVVQSLTDFYNAQETASRAADALASAVEELRDTTFNYNQEMATMQTLMAAYEVGGTNAARVAQRQADIVNDLAQKMEEWRVSGMSAQDIIDKATALATMNVELVNQRLVLDAVKTAADQNKEAMDSWISSSLDGLADLIVKGGDLKSVLAGIVQEFLKMQINQNVLTPLKNMMGLGEAGGQSPVSLSSVLGGLGLGGTTEDPNAAAVSALGSAALNSAESLQSDFIDSVLGGAAETATQAATTAAVSGEMVGMTTIITGLNLVLTEMTLAAQAAASAMAAMAAASSAGGGSDFLGTVISSVFGAMSGNTTVPGLGGGAPGRAMGGPVTWGKQYKTHGLATGEELFIPSTSGKVVPSSQLTSQESPVIITIGPTHIDARGATPDAVARLEAMQERRDKQLRQEIPLMIDSRITSNRVRNRR